MFKKFKIGIVTLGLVLLSGGIYLVGTQASKVSLYFENQSIHSEYEASEKKLDELKTAEARAVQATKDQIVVVEKNICLRAISDGRITKGKVSDEIYNTIEKFCHDKSIVPSELRPRIVRIVEKVPVVHEKIVFASEEEWGADVLNGLEDQVNFYSQE